MRAIAKTRIYVLLSFTSLLILAAACGKKAENQLVVPEGEAASISVEIKGQSDGAKSTKAVGIPDLGHESDLKYFKVYIFNSSDKLVKIVDHPSSTTVIDGLKTGSARIVVLANLSSYPSIAIEDTYAMLASKTTALGDFATNIVADGLPMSGEVSTTLAAGLQTVSLEISRMVARVLLKTLKIEAPDAGKAGVNITHVHIMKAKAESTVLGSDGYLDVSTSAYWGGMTDLGLVSTVPQIFLTGKFTPAYTGVGPNEVNAYFYLLPNNGSTNPTQITLVSEVAGDIRYFPVQINDEQTGIITGNNSVTFLKRNCTYLINVTLKHHGQGTVTPEDRPAAIKVVVTVASWELNVNQDVTFN